MKNKIIIVDTSILCCWLNVAGKETCGPEYDKWDNERVEKYIKEETNKGSTLVLPFPVIIETGNHIAQSKMGRYDCALSFVDMINKSLDSETPWAAFSNQSELWDKENMRVLLKNWPEMVRPDTKGNLSMGDIMIKSVADYYSKIDKYQVEILTGDQGLKIYENVDLKEVNIPRRRKRR